MEFLLEGGELLVVLLEVLSEGNNKGRIKDDRGWVFSSPWVMRIFRGEQSLGDGYEFFSFSEGEFGVDQGSTKEVPDRDGKGNVHWMFPGQEFVLGGGKKMLRLIWDNNVGNT
ncbi:MAG TPA: hypothetical protein VLN58_16445 [Verrucomicrobiae bacterium]|nr:hypothetical protein [Verrucomicrobiae bacterium]